MPDYNSMQANAGLLPQPGGFALPQPQLVFPGQVAAMVAMQSQQQFGGMFPTNTYTPAFGASPLFQGPTGFITPMGAGAPFNPYAPSNPYSNMLPYGSAGGRPSPFSAPLPLPPPAYAGLQGLGAAPYAPLPIASPFDTPYGSAIAQAQASHMRGWATGQAGAGVGVRVGTTLGAAAIGGMLGGPLGMAGGALLAEGSGLSRGLQNLYASHVSAPRLAVQGAAQGLEHISQGFIHSGAHLNPSGAGFTHHAAYEAAQGLSDLAGSSAFRRETHGRFNQQDVFRITQGAAENGMLNGTSSPQQLTARVREVAKSLSAFMELAKEPDIQRAIQTMGSLRSSGLNLQETMSAIQSGRTFARMAGTSFQALSETGGALGSQMYQSMGLSQGLGFRVGMGAYGQASASINQGVLSPQVASLVGGREGLAMLNSTFSASQLQLPMTAMGLMGAGGGLSASAMQSYLHGGGDVFGLTSRGAGTLGGIAGRLGVGGLGMAVGMQPLIQDTVGRILEERGPLARRNVEDRSIMNLMRSMGMTGSHGFMTAAQMSGMQGTAAYARTQELQSGAYWETQQDQLRTEAREARAMAERDRRVNAPRVIDSMLRGTSAGDALGAARAAWHHAGVGLSRAFGGSETHDYDGSPTTDAGRRRFDQMVHSGRLREYVDSLPTSSRGIPGGIQGVGYGTSLAWAGGSRGALATLDGFFMGNDSFRNRAAQDYRAGGDYASRMLSATNRDQREAYGRLGETFGSAEGLEQFTARASDIAQNANSPSRVLASRLTFGAFGSRAISGSSLERAFRDTLRGQGVNDAEIARRWREQGTTIAAQHALQRRAYGETDAEREAWQTTAESQSRFAGGNSRMGRIREDAERSYQGLLGDVGREGQEGFRAVTDEVEGLGPEGSRRNQLSRRLMTGLVLAQVNRMHGGAGGQRASREAVDRLRAEAERAGLSREDIATVIDRSSGISQRHQGSDGVRAAARGFVAHGGGLDAIGGTEEARLREVGARRALAGFGQLAREGGAVGALFGGLTESNVSSEELMRRIQAMSPEERRRLQQTRGQEGLARAVEQARGGDARGLDAIFARAGQVGRDAIALEHEYDRGEGSGVGGWFRRQVGSYDNARARWVQEQLRTASPEEREARVRRDEALDAQGTARRAGIGSPGDALLEASRELHEVARNLREVTQGNNIAGLVGRSQ